MKFEIKKTKLIGGGHVIDANILPNTRAGVDPKVIFSFDTHEHAWDFLEDLKAVICKHLPHTSLKTDIKTTPPSERLKSMP